MTLLFSFHILGQGHASQCAEKSCGKKSWWGRPGRAALLGQGALSVLEILRQLSLRGSPADKKGW
jgi:hypothetical protein